MILYILLAIVIFGLLIIVHELGHFAVAKACGIRVEEFSVGMGPAIISREKGETLYSLRCIPFGGYCAMTGEDGGSDDPRAFSAQNPLKRVLVLVAGAAMNFLLGLLIVIILFSNAVAFAAPVIAGFMEGCPYEASETEPGFAPDDRFYKIDGHRVYSTSDISDYLDAGTGTHDIVVLRDGKKVRLDAFKITRLEYPGYETKMYGFNLGYEEATLPVILRNSWETTMEFVRWVWQGLGELFSGTAKMADLSGPVGIVDLMAETGEQAESTADALYSIFYLAAFIAVNLAVMNMLPIPGLDGGRLFLLVVTWVIESLTGRKLNPKYEAYINAAGMVLLLALMAIIMFNDVVRLVKGG